MRAGVKMPGQKCEEAVKSRNDNQEDMRQLDTSGLIFPQMIDEGMLYIDKTLLVDDLLRTNPRGVYLYTRPRRFGKSNNLTMLQEFFDIKSRGTHRFDGLEISKPEYSKYDVHRNSYNVVRIDFKECEADDYEAFLRITRIVIATEVSRLIENADMSVLSSVDAAILKQVIDMTADPETLQISIRTLCRVLYKTNNLRTVILIDEYDTPISHETDGETQKRILDFLSRFLSASLKGNEYLQLGFVTGILQIAKESMFSKLNNVVMNNIFSTTSDERYGFTESEVRSILEDQECLDRFDTVRLWYDGYRFGDADIYNPKSIAFFSKNGGKVGYYWTGDNSGAAVRTLFKGLSAESFDTVGAIVKGETIEHELDAGINLDQLERGSLTTVLTVLAMSGYLKAIPTETPKVYRLSMPNLEVRDSVQEKLEDSAFLPTNLISKMRNALLSNDTKILCENLEEILSSESYFDLRDERDYQQILLTVLTLIRGDCTVVSQRESGAGRSDILMTSDNRPSIIFELKRSRREEDLEKDAEAALKQIHDRKYYAGLKGDVILYGISFWYKFPCVKSEIVKLD